MSLSPWYCHIKEKKKKKKQAATQMMFSEMFQKVAQTRIRKYHHKILFGKLKFEEKQKIRFQIRAGTQLDKQLTKGRNSLFYYCMHIPGIVLGTQ